MMLEEDPTKYEAHFSKFIEHDVDADKVEEMYGEAHAKIRADPTHAASEKKGITHEREGSRLTSSDGTEHARFKKIGLEKRRGKVAAKIAAAQAKMVADMEDDDE